MEDGDEWEKVQKNYWDGVAQGYDDLYVDRWSLAENAQTRQWLLSLNIAAGDSILDIACGTGLGYELTALRIPRLEYWGLDISSKMLAILQGKFPAARVSNGSFADISRLGECRFHHVICLNSAFSFAPDPNDAFRQIAFVLKPKGHAFISVLNRWSMRRILRLRFARTEQFSTRHAAHRMGHVPALTYDKADLARLIDGTALVRQCIYSQGFFAGVIEAASLEGFEGLLSNLAPGLCHIHNLVAQKIA